MALTAAQREDLIRRYEEGPRILRDAFAKVPREAWKWRPEDGKWSAQEVVCHCADSEMNARRADPLPDRRGEPDDRGL